MHKRSKKRKRDPNFAEKGGMMIISMISTRIWKLRLKLLKIKKDVQELVNILLDEKLSERVRCQAASALGEIGDPKAVEPLINSLNDKDGVVRCQAASALGEIGDPKAVEPLIAQLTLHHWNMPGLGSESFIGSEDNITSIMSNMKNSYIVNFGDKSLYSYSFGSMLNEINDLSTKMKVLDVRIEILKNYHARLRRASATALGKIGEPRAVTKLIDSLRCDEKLSQLAAVYYCKKLDRPRVETPIVIALNKGKESKKTHSKDISKSLKIITTLFGEEFRETHSAFAESLAMFGTPAVDPIISSLSHPWWFVRKNFVKALGTIGDTKAIKPITALAYDEDPDVREAASIAFKNLKESDD